MRRRRHRRRAPRRARRGRDSTAFWFTMPLSVISCASIDGGSSSRIARATRVELPVSRRERVEALCEPSGHAGCVRSCRGEPSPACPQLRGTSRRSGNESADERRDRAPRSRRRDARSPKCASSLARSGPTLTHVPVESLKSSRDAAVERESLRRVGGIDEAQRVAELVVALLVERRARQLRVAPVAGRDVRPAQSRLRACRRPERASAPRPARARRSARPVNAASPVQSANGALSVAPSPVTIRNRARRRPRSRAR